MRDVFYFMDKINSSRSEEFRFHAALHGRKLNAPQESLNDALPREKTDKMNQIAEKRLRELQKKHGEKIVTNN